MSRGGMVSTSIALMLATPAMALADDKKPVPVQQPAAVDPTCEVVEIWASSKGKGGCDASIDKTLCKRLTSNFKWTEYKQLSSTAKTFEKKKAETVTLKKGKATITVVEIVNKSSVRVKIDFTAAKGKSDGTFLVAGGDWIPIVAKQSNDPDAEGHVLAVGNCK